MFLFPLHICLGASVLAVGLPWPASAMAPGHAWPCPCWCIHKYTKHLGAGVVCWSCVRSGAASAGGCRWHRHRQGAAAETRACTAAPGFAPAGVSMVRLVTRHAFVALAALVPSGARFAFFPSLHCRGLAAAGHGPSCSWPQARGRHRGCRPQVCAVAVVPVDGGQARRARD